MVNIIIANFGFRHAPWPLSVASCAHLTVKSMFDTQQT